jgi:archaemetzincin
VNPEAGPAARQAPAAVVVALGDLPPRLLAEVAAALAPALGLGWKHGPPLDRPTYAWNAGRRQYHAPAVLRRLAALRPAAGAPGPVLGLVQGDLFLPEEGDYVLFDADRDLGAAVVGLGRLGTDPVALRRRAQVQAVHALGHVLGLAVCSDVRCAMHASNEPADSDRNGPGLCAGCRSALGLR